MKVNLSPEEVHKRRVAGRKNAWEVAKAMAAVLPRDVDFDEIKGAVANKAGFNNESRNKIKSYIDANCYEGGRLVKMYMDLAELLSDAGVSGYQSVKPSSDSRWYAAQTIVPFVSDGINKNELRSKISEKGGTTPEEKERILDYCRKHADSEGMPTVVHESFEDLKRAALEDEACA